MGSKWKRCIVAVATVGLVMAAGMTNALAASTTSYSRFIDAGAGTATNAGGRTWEAQTGFTGGTVNSNVALRKESVLPQAVANTALVGPSAFSLAVPNGNYSVTLYVARYNTSPVTVTAEGVAKKTIIVGTAVPRAVITYTLSTKVSDGNLNLGFSPSPSQLSILALVVRGQIPVSGGAATTTTTTKSTTTTTKAPTTTTTVKPTTTTTVKPTTTTTVKSTTTTTALPAPTGGNCTNPTYTTSDAEGTTGALDDSGTWWVNNDAWSGSAGPQTLSVCNQSSWTAVSNQADNGGQVETYPDTEYDIGGRDSGTPTKTIAQYNSITSTFSEAYPSAGSWDAAYDLWTNNWSNETMVWNQWTGTEDFWGNCAEPGSSQNDCVGSGGASANSKAATIDGVAYHFLALGSNCSAANESDCEYIFFRDSQVASGSVDILAIYQWEVANGLAKSTDVPTQLEYGVEVCSTTGSESFPMTGLTFNVS